MSPARATPVSAGRVLAGRYTVGEVIGRGGMADVHVGRDTSTGRSVAIKALRSTSAEHPLLRSSLRREAQLLARVRHHSIVALLDAGHGSSDGDDGDGSASVSTHGSPYIVMEHVDGRSLRELLRAGELTRETSVRYQLGLLAALEASHRAGIVHRDVKPANVMVTTGGAVKLVDFGIAGDSGDSTATVTHVQELIGTPAYFSPEQARGETTDARSDLYSAGCLLFELLAGRPPFPGDDPVRVAHQHVHEPAPHADTGVPSLDAVIATALVKDRAERFQSAQAFRAALESATRTVAHDVADSTSTWRGAVDLDDAGIARASGDPTVTVTHIQELLGGVRSHGAVITTAPARSSVRRLQTAPGFRESLRSA